MSDGWTDIAGRTLLNFLVNSPKGTIFIKFVDATEVVKNAKLLFTLLDEVVEEVGEENVIHVITDGERNYVNAGKRLMEKRKHIFWTPCAAHCIDLMLENIGEMPIHKAVIKKCKKLTVYIYNHSWVLQLMKKFTKGRELVRHAVTRFATCYLTMRSVIEQHKGLVALFASEEWQTSQYAKKKEGLEVRDLILADSKFWNSLKYCLKCTMPLVKVLRLVDYDAKPPMRCVYEAMDRAKETIAKNLGHVERRYVPIWNIIDERWDKQLHRPLHAAGFFFNPRFQYNLECQMDEVKEGLYDTLDKMVPTVAERVVVDEEITMFRKVEGMFSREIAKLTMVKKQPADWWDSFGDSTPNLQRIAIKVLNLTCTFSGCERNWSTFQHIHGKKRNRLQQKRLNALVFVNYNLQLHMHKECRMEKGLNHDPISLSDMESNDEWITEKESPALPSDISWLELGDCVEEEIPQVNTGKRGPNDYRYVASSGKGKGILRDEEEDLSEDSERDEEEEGYYEEDEDEEMQFGGPRGYGEDEDEDLDDD